MADGIAASEERKLFYDPRDLRDAQITSGGWSNTDRQPSGERPTPSSTAQRPTTTDRSTTDQLNRDAAARREGTQRSGDYSNYRSGASSTPRSTGSYRGGGGMSRGGGGGRRR